MATDLKKRVAARLKGIIGKQRKLDLGPQGGPSLSYIYRMLQGQNMSIDELDAVLLAYGSNLGEFFAPWREEDQAQRQRLIVEARTRIERILGSDEVDTAVINGLVLSLRLMDPGEPPSTSRKRSESKRK